MSKIGKQIIKIPEGVNVAIGEEEILVKSPKGELKIPILKGVKALLEGETLKFALANDTKQARSNWGTLRSLVFNAIYGLRRGFEKVLVLEGIGYRIAKEGDDLIFNLGFSHPVRYRARPGISFEVEKNTILKIRGSDKALVGQVAAEIRALKKPEPYKGKGFRYLDETIRRKVGKRAVSAAGV